MLPFDDERWSLLTTFYKDGRYLAQQLREWTFALGFDQEYEIFSHTLFDLFLHQGTITNAAFAVAPYLVDACLRQQTQNDVEYLSAVGLIEANRLTYGLYSNRPGTEEFPDWLMADYHRCISECVNLVDDVLASCKSKDRRRSLLAIKPAFHGNGKLALENR